MNLIIPMAGMGKRMRPHTLTIPKPLIKIAGKPIVQLIIEEITTSIDDKIDEIAFVIGNFGSDVENMLHQIAKDLGAKSKIYYQEEPLGTAHAIYCARESLEGEVIVAFADTLFKGNITLNKNCDSIIWVKEVEDPSQFGVVKLDSSNRITQFVEKSSIFVSNLAIIGIYYFRDGHGLKEEICYIIDNNITAGNEYQLTTILDNMVAKNKIMLPGKVDKWMDCGNKNATVKTHNEIIKTIDFSNSNNFHLNDSLIIQPCFIGENVTITNSIIGPHVSIGNNTEITSSIIKNSIIQENSSIDSDLIKNSMIGSSTFIKGNMKDYNIGDYCNIQS